MIDIEPLIRDALARHLPPPPDPELRDWQGVLARAGRPSRRRRRRLAVAVVALTALLVLVASPLGGAIQSGVTGFSDWLTGTPGEPASADAQREFEQANVRAGSRFPGDPQLHELVRFDRDGRSFILYGFETGQVVCLRVEVRGIDGVGPQTACASRSDLRRSGDLVLPVKANLSTGQIGPLPPNAGDPPTTPRYLLTFGLAAAEVARVRVETGDGASPAVVRNGAFLHVFAPGRRGNWTTSVEAMTRTGRADVVPVSIQASGQRRLATGLKLHGPAKVERNIRNGTIGWFVKREPRGTSARAAGLSRGRDCCTGFVRLIYPDPDDFLGLAIGDDTLVARGPRAQLFKAGYDICHGAVTRGGSSASCTNTRQLFRDRPLSLGWGFSGAGQQLWVVSGLASDDVARIEVFQGDGKRWQAPLRDNATIFRVQRAKFPVRVVAYDRAGRVIGVQAIRG